MLKLKFVAMIDWNKMGSVQIFMVLCTQHNKHHLDNVDDCGYLGLGHDNRIPFMDIIPINKYWNAKFLQWLIEIRSDLSK